jgi:hypothetical protein
MRRSYPVPMRWMVIYEYEVPGGALNLNFTNNPEVPPLSGKNPHGRAGNRPRDLIISSQKCWPLDQEAGHKYECNKDKISLNIKKVNYSVLRAGGSLESESLHCRLGSGNSWEEALGENEFARGRSAYKQKLKEKSDAPHISEKL